MLLSSPNTTMPTEETKVPSGEKSVAREGKERKKAPKHTSSGKKRGDITNIGFQAFFSCVYLLAAWAFVIYVREDAPKFITAFLFHRLVGVIFIIAFISTWKQIIGLCGENGIQPIKGTMDLVKEVGRSKISFPTVFWWGSSDLFIKFICAAGLVSSMFYTFNILPSISLAISWLFFLSFKVVGREFFALQFDNLLLDTGLLAFLLPPIRFFPFTSIPTTPFYQNSITWLVGWLGFRLMVGSGLCKITSGDKTWRDGTALSYHYWTQPMPNWIAYYVDKSPLWFHRICCYFHFVVELVVPFGFFWPFLALPTFVLLASLQIGILATGNYGFFNLLSILIPLSLLRDEMYPQFISHSLVQFIDVPSSPTGILAWVENSIAMGLVIIVLGLSLVPFAQVARGALWVPSWIASIHSEISLLQNKILWSK